MKEPERLQEQLGGDEEAARVSMPPDKPRPDELSASMADLSVSEPLSDVGKEQHSALEESQTAQEATMEGTATKACGAVKWFSSSKGVHVHLT